MGDMLPHLLIGRVEERLGMTYLWAGRFPSTQFLKYGSQDTPTIAEGTQIALTPDTPMLKARNFGNFQLSFMHAQIDHCLNFEAITINFNTGNAVPPEAVIAITQVSKARAKEHVD